MSTAQSMEVDPATEPEDLDVIAAQVINEEYKTWKKNAHLLYDTFYSRVLDWPTLTTQWFPDKKVSAEDGTATHRLLLGTQTSQGAPNFIQIAHFQTPVDRSADAIDYNPDNEEMGGHGARKERAPAPKFHIVQQIPHEGDVNTARYMPQNCELIATITGAGGLYVWDRTKHPSQPGGQPNPQIELVGHTGEGYALNWNPNTEGELVTGTDDHVVKLWDIQGYSKASKSLQATRTYTHHTAVVNDVEFHPVLKWMIATVSDDLSLQILDTRSASTDQAAKQVQRAHTDAVNAVAFNHASEFVLATGSADRSIALWDLRMLREKLHAIEGHADVVTKIEWCPQEKQVIASASADRRIDFWDLNNIGKEQTPDDAEDGPPELMFMHGGHTNRISDFSFNKNDPYLMLSAAEDNLVHVWTPNDACLHGTDTADVPMEELEA